MQADTSAGAAPRSPFREIFKKAASLLGARVLGNILTLGYTVLIARLVPVAEFGIVMAGFSWAMLLSIVLSLNVESGSIRFLVGYIDAGNRSHATGFVHYNRLLIGAFSGLALVAFALLCWADVLDASQEVVQIFGVALIAAPIVALTRVYGRHATALGQVLRGGLPIMLARPATIFCLVGIFWLSGAQPTALQLICLILAAFVVTAGMQAYLLRQTFRFAQGAAPNYADQRKWLETGLAMAPLLLLRDNLKHVIVASAGLVLSATEVGQVALALSIMSLLYFAIKAVDISLSPQLSRALQAKNSQRVTELVGASAKLKLAVLMSGAVGVIVLGDWVLALFGEEYLGAHMALLAAAVIPLADGLFGPAQIVLNVSGHQRYVFVVAGFGAILLFLATLLGGWGGGAIGAIIGASLAYTIQQYLLCLMSNRSAGIDTSALSVLR